MYVMLLREKIENSSQNESEGAVVNWSLASQGSHSTYISFPLFVVYSTPDEIWVWDLLVQFSRVFYFGSSHSFSGSCLASKHFATHNGERHHNFAHSKVCKHFG